MTGASHGFLELRCQCGVSHETRWVPLPGGARGSAHCLLFGLFPVWGDEEGQYRHSPAGLWVNRYLFLLLEGRSWEWGAGLSGESMLPFLRSCRCSQRAAPCHGPSVRLLVARPLDSGNLLLSGPPRRVVRPSVPFWGQTSAPEVGGGPDPSAARQHRSASLGIHSWRKGKERWPQPHLEDALRRQQVLRGGPGAAFPRLTGQCFLPRTPLCLGTRVLQHGRERLWPDSGLYMHTQSPGMCVHPIHVCAYHDGLPNSHRIRTPTASHRHCGGTGSLKFLQSRERGVCLGWGVVELA